MIKLEYLRTKRRFAFAFIFIFVGFLPPPDILSTIIQALPLVFMYEMTIQLNSLFNLPTMITMRIFKDDDIVEIQTG